MSLFNWFKKKHAPLEAESSGLSRVESTKPFLPRRPELAAPAAPGQPANRKSERMARRELLYAVVRESMMRAGVLSASYKFKVLSLDARGRQFLVMVDLAREFGADPHGLSEIEAMIAQSAKSRYDILVTAVYWRTNDHVAVGQPVARAAALTQPQAAAAAQPARTSRPVPLAAEAPSSRPAPLAPAEPPSRPAPLHASREREDEPTIKLPAHRYEPIQADEVEAFKRALAAGSTAQAAVAAAAAQQQDGAVARGFDGSVKHGPQSYTLLTGFEDTEVADGAPMPALSATQYGDLR